MSDAITINLHTGHGGQLPSLQGAWDRCLHHCPPTQHLFNYGWYQAWFATYGSSPPWCGDSWVLTADQANETVAVLPLVRSRQRGLNVLSLAGLYQPVRSWPCIPDQATIISEKLVERLITMRRQWDILRLGPIDDAAPEREALIKALHNAGLRVMENALGRTIVNRLETSMAAYEGTHALKDMRYYERRFLRDAKSEVRHIHNPNPDDLRHVLADCRTVEERSWLADADGDLRFGDARDIDFWSVAAPALYARGHLDIWTAHMDGAPVAFRFVLTTGDTSYLIANQYDATKKKYSLGWILYRHNLELAIQRGTRLIDSAPGDL
ncbi:MAG: GNAT family N-acetyltransferase, partial [Verrucomicrobia bacterium]|nr:GNAT family N-acetyltransferase [Verrucomicrobiota bacterium]